LSTVDQKTAAVPLAQRLRFERRMQKTLDKELRILSAYLPYRKSKLIFICGFLTGGLFS
jgi:hypothetical protein